MNTILVVDDMAVIREPIGASLRLAGYQTLLASNGSEALEVAKQEKPDLILLDLAMPEMHGIGFLKHQQQDEDLRDVPVILLTAVTDKQHVVDAARLGVQDCLLKSAFSMEQLITRVERRLATAAASTASKDTPASPAEEPADLPPDASASEIADYVNKSSDILDDDLTDDAD